MPDGKHVHGPDCDWLDGRQGATDCRDGFAYEPGRGSDGPCMDCGRPCPVRSTDNDLWNETIGGSAGLLCPTCFMYRADKPKRIFDVTLRQRKEAPNALGACRAARATA